MKRIPFNRLAATATIATLLPGCWPGVKFRQCPPAPTVSGACEPCEDTSLGFFTSTEPTPEPSAPVGPLPVTASSPFVRIIGESAPPTAYPELELLAAELHSALTYRGGVRLEDSALVARLPTDRCNTDEIGGGFCSPVAHDDDDESMKKAEGEEDTEQADQSQSPIRKVSAQMYEYFNAPFEQPVPMPDSSLGQFYQAPGPGLQIPAAPVPSGPMPSPVVSTGPAASPQPGGQYEVSVILNDFTPYRPMQLAATIVVRDIDGGQEVQRFQRVWRGTVHEPSFELTRKARKQDLHHPATFERHEHTALPDISPRHLIKRAAVEVAESLHESVLDR